MMHWVIHNTNLLRNYIKQQQLKLHGKTRYNRFRLNMCTYRRYFQHAHFIPIVGVGKRGEY